jgi:hypothetical protein
MYFEVSNNSYQQIFIWIGNVILQRVWTEKYYIILNIYVVGDESRYNFQKGVPNCFNMFLQLSLVNKNNYPQLFDTIVTITIIKSNYKNYLLEKLFHTKI